ncbi:hypothetical protein ZWY2020_030975 [Hordeum vulgare]|nr:hypothetical protein ZWY2020_030975 [Hordeum vulgare]
MWCGPRGASIKKLPRRARAATCVLGDNPGVAAVSVNRPVGPPWRARVVIRPPGAPTRPDRVETDGDRARHGDGTYLSAAVAMTATAALPPPLLLPPHPAYVRFVSARASAAA